MRAVRLHDRPIFTPDLHPSIGRNIPGPSAIRVPDWTAHWLGITISISPITRAATFGSPTPIGSPDLGRFIRPATCNSKNPVS